MRLERLHAKTHVMSPTPSNLNSAGNSMWDHSAGNKLAIKR